MDLLNITLLKGGFNSEREISLRTGNAANKALRLLGHIVHEVDVQSPDFEIPAESDFVFIALHGGFGENGELQSILTKKGLRFSGCGEAASRLAMDKIASKERFLKAGVPIAKSAQWTPETVWPFPFILKPISDGSSVGVFRVFNEADLKEAREGAKKLGLSMMIEEMVIGKELTVGILGNDVLPIIEIRPKTEFYNYTNKYTAGCTEYLCPAPLPVDVTKNVQDAALTAYRSLGCEVYGRVDVMLNEKNEPFVLEANTIPGMTELSLLPKAAGVAGISFPELCQKIIDLSWDVKR